MSRISPDSKIRTLLNISLEGSPVRHGNRLVTRVCIITEKHMISSEEILILQQGEESLKVHFRRYHPRANLQVHRRRTAIF